MRKKDIFGVLCLSKLAVTVFLDGTLSVDLDKRTMHLDPGLISLIKSPLLT